jgi:hypothetical protein
MSSVEYHFITYWNVSGSIDDVYDILYDVSEYPRWWPSLARSYECTEKGDAKGVGARGNIVTKGFLPYVIRWSYEVVQTDRPNEFRIAASGDLTGTGHWILQQQDSFIAITYEWNVRTEKRLLRILSPIFRPLFAWNHDWVMQRGLEGLKRELQTRANS